MNYTSQIAIILLICFFLLLLNYKSYQPWQPYQLRYCTNKMDQSKQKANEYIDTNDETLPADKNNLQLMKPYILNLCKGYLFGIWKSITINDFNIYKPK